MKKISSSFDYGDVKTDYSDNKALAGFARVVDHIMKIADLLDFKILLLSIHLRQT